MKKIKGVCKKKAVKSSFDDTVEYYKNAKGGRLHFKNGIAAEKFIAIMEKLEKDAKSLSKIKFNNSTNFKQGSSKKSTAKK